MKYKAAVFDMDGTVLDTVGDLTDAVNYTMEQLGYGGNFSDEDAKLFFGSGVRVALTRAFAVLNGIANGYDLLKVGTENDDISPRINMDEVSKAEAIYKPYYSTHNDIKTGEYPGITGLLKDLRKSGILTAVVSNKPDDSVVSLSDNLFKDLFDICLGEKDGIKRKPAPDMTLKVLNELGVEARDAVYIGDSEIDLLTAGNSGLDCIAVSWGFRSRDFLKAHGAEIIVDTAEEIKNILC